MNRRLGYYGAVAVALLTPAAVTLAGTRWPGYNPTAQTISELVARHAPDRLFLSALFALYNLLLVGFGLSLIGLARERGPVGRAGIRGGRRVILLGVLGLALLLAPMDAPGGDRTVTGVIHMVVAGGMAATATTAAFWCGLWWQREPALAGYGRFSLVMAVVMGALAAATFVALRLDRLAGLTERWLVYSYEVWMAIAAAGLARFERRLALSGQQATGGPTAARGRSLPQRGR